MPSATPSRPSPSTAGHVDLLRKRFLAEGKVLVRPTRLGSFYTPARYVRLVGEWLLRHGVGNGWTIADLSCGSGAFFALEETGGLRDRRGRARIPFRRKRHRLQVCAADGWR